MLPEAVCDGIAALPFAPPEAAIFDGRELHAAGTDLYDSSPEHKLVASVTYEWNTGLIFIPGNNTWHGANFACSAAA